MKKLLVLLVIPLVSLSLAFSQNISKGDSDKGGQKQFKGDGAKGHKGGKIGSHEIKGGKGDRGGPKGHKGGKGSPKGNKGSSTAN